MRASFLFLVPTRLLVNSNSARYPAFRLHTSVAFHEITPIETERKDITYQKNKNSIVFSEHPVADSVYVTRNYSVV